MRLGSLLSVLIHRGIPITVKVKALYVVRGLKRETLLCTRILYKTISASQELHLFTNQFTSVFNTDEKKSKHI